MQWNPTKKINPYTGKPNKACFINGFQLCVYRRMYGWAYTCRVDFVGGRWLELASNKSLPTENEAKEAAIQSMYDLEDMSSPAYDVIPEMEDLFENHPHSPR